MVSDFFGLTSKEAFTLHKHVFKTIHEIVFHGKGGYDWHTVYDMPIWLRNFTFTEIKKYYDDEAAAVKKANSKSSKSGNTTTTNILDSSGKINPPSFQGKSSYN